MGSKIRKSGVQRANVRKHYPILIRLKRQVLMSQRSTWLWAIRTNMTSNAFCLALLFVWSLLLSSCFVLIGIAWSLCGSSCTFAWLSCCSSSLLWLPWPLRSSNFLVLRLLIGPCLVQNGPELACGSSLAFDWSW